MRRIPAKSGKTIAVLLAIGVHIALALFLVFGVQWQNRHPETMMVEVVPAPAVSTVAPPKLVTPPAPTPPPEPAPPPTPPESHPAPPEPPPVAKAEARPVPAQPSKADIALKAKQEKEKLEKERAELERELQDKARREQDKLVRDQRERELRELAKREADKREREVKELARREADKRETKLAQQRAQNVAEDRRRREDLQRVEREQREQKEKIDAQQAASKAAASKAFADYVNRIQAKIRGNVILPPEVIGNPEAVFEVVQLPTGEIISEELRKSSGSRVYDEAVSRAILKSSPLPKPDSADQFQRSLLLKFRPQS